MAEEWSRCNKGIREQGNKGVREVGNRALLANSNHEQVSVTPTESPRFQYRCMARVRGSQSVDISFSFWDRY